MQNNKEDSLFQLIKSLNKNEKRFFTLYSELFNQDKIPKYLYLYRALEKMPFYNQSHLLQKIKKFVPSKNLHPLKRYLKVHLLEVLSLYDQGNDKNAQQFGQISNAMILLKRNFIPEAEKILKAQKKQALANDRFVLGNHINQVLIACIDHKGAGTVNDAKIQEAYCQDSLDLVNKQLELTKLNIISKKVQLIIESKKETIEEMHIDLKKVVEEELSILNKDNYQTTNARWLHENISDTIHSALNKSQINKEE